MSRFPWRFAAAIVLLTFAAFWPVLLNDFVAWDDPYTIIERPDGVKFWREPLGGLYVPLTYTTWSAIGALARDSAGKLHAWPFHLVSLIVHCASALLVFAILRRLIQRDWPACLGALLFAVHPLQVESVAWASGLKDVLAGCLALAALHQHLRSRAFLSTALFALAMLAKPSAASAILIVVVVDLLILRRSFRHMIAMVGIWLIVAIPLLVIARLVQTTEFVQYIPIFKRPLIAIDAITFYLIKIIAPLGLTIDYGRTQARVLSAGLWIPMAIALLSGIAIAMSRSRVLIGAALIMLAGLIWNLGLVPFQFQLYSTVADHYMYLAMLGPALALAYVMQQFPRAPLVALAATWIALLGALSFRQTFVWRDSVTLFTHATTINPQSAGLHNNLGRALGERDDLDRAARHFEAALAIQSGTPLAHRNLALVHFRRGDIDAAIDHLSQAVSMMEQSGDDVSGDRKQLVRWLAGAGRWREVVEQLERAQLNDPANVEIARLLEDARRRAATTTTSPTDP